MTIKELVTMVQHLDWRRSNDGKIRCANGDCPVLAAYRIMFPEGELVGRNDRVYTASDILGLSYDEVSKIVNAADDRIRHTTCSCDDCQAYKASEILALVTD